MEKLLCRKDIEKMFGCKKDKALEIMKKMPHLNIGTDRKPNLRVREEVASRWLYANEVDPRNDRPPERRQKPRRPPTRSLPNDGKHLIPRRRTTGAEQTKSPGDVAASTGAGIKNHHQYTTIARETQVQNA